MRKSSKLILAVVSTAVLSIGAVNLASAYGGGKYCNKDEQSREYSRGGDGRMGMRDKHRMRNPEQMEQRMNERLAYLKQELKITSEQESAWQAFETTLQNKANRMMGRFKDGGMRGPMPVQDRVSMMRERATDMSQMADSIEKLYAELTPEQQKTADQLKMFRRMK